MRKALILLVATGLVGANSAQASERKKNDDPNRMICEKQEVLGTRLASKRVCKTAAEWEAERRQDRQAIDKAQTQIYVKQ